MEEAEECGHSYWPVCCAVRIGRCVQWALYSASTVTVIGRRALGGLSPVALCLRMPSMVRFKMGSEDWSHGAQGKLHANAPLTSMT